MALKATFQWPWRAPVTTPLYSAPEVPALARGFGTSAVQELVLCSLVLTYLTNVTWMAGGLSDMSFATIYLKHAPGGLKTEFLSFLACGLSLYFLKTGWLSIFFRSSTEPNPNVVNSWLPMEGVQVEEVLCCVWHVVIGCNLLWGLLSLAFMSGIFTKDKLITD